MRFWVSLGALALAALSAEGRSIKRLPSSILRRKRQADGEWETSSSYSSSYETVPGGYTYETSFVPGGYSYSSSYSSGGGGGGGAAFSTKIKNTKKIKKSKKVKKSKKIKKKKISKKKKIAKKKKKVAKPEPKPEPKKDTIQIFRGYVIQPTTRYQPIEYVPQYQYIQPPVAPVAPVAPIVPRYIPPAPIAPVAPPVTIGGGQAGTIIGRFEEVPVDSVQGGQISAGSLPTPPGGEKAAEDSYIKGYLAGYAAMVQGGSNGFGFGSGYLGGIGGYSGFGSGFGSSGFGSTGFGSSWNSRGMYNPFNKKKKL